MAQARINPLIKERDFETVYYGSIPYVVEKNFKVFDFDFVRFLYIENYKRKQDSGSDYYQFQFNSTEEANINDLGLELKQGTHLDAPKPKEVVKEVKKEVIEEKVEKKVKKKPLRKRFKL